MLPLDSLKITSSKPLQFQSIILIKRKTTKSNNKAPNKYSHLNWLNEKLAKMKMKKTHRLIQVTGKFLILFQL